MAIDRVSSDGMQSWIDLRDLQPAVGGSAGGQATVEGRVVEEMRRNGLSVPSGTPAAGGGSKTFAELLQNSLEEVNLHQNQADRAIKELVAGRTKNVHETLLAIERADSSLKLAMQVRNKVLEAYREIMRMQV
jgi:flagellar hook-basal body complex protein FliE